MAKLFTNLMLFLSGMIAYICANPTVVFVIGVIAIFLLTQLCKIPVKKLTVKITNIRVRRITNSVIFLIPFGFACLYAFAYGCLYLHEAFSVELAVSYFTGSLAVYGIIERFFKVKISNPYATTTEGEAVKELVEDVTEDKKVNAKDKNALKEFWSKIKK